MLLVACIFGGVGGGLWVSICPHTNVPRGTFNREHYLLVKGVVFGTPKTLGRVKRRETTILDKHS